MNNTVNLSTADAVKKLKIGNGKYMSSFAGTGDISPQKRLETYENGQNPYAVIITCSDSRVIPEAIFSAGIGDLFVIRVAGNVIGSHQLGSIEYAAEHLGCKLAVVLGHTHCGAVGAAIERASDGYIKSITDDIIRAIGGETDDLKACRLNVLHSVSVIENSLDIRGADDDPKLRVIGAVYDIKDGHVEFIE